MQHLFNDKKKKMYGKVTPKEKYTSQTEQQKNTLMVSDRKTLICKCFFSERHFYVPGVDECIIIIFCYI